MCVKVRQTQANFDVPSFGFLFCFLLFLEQFGVQLSIQQARNPVFSTTLDQ